MSTHNIFRSLRRALVRLCHGPARAPHRLARPFTNELEVRLAFEARAEPAAVAPELIAQAIENGETPFELGMAVYA